LLSIADTISAAKSSLIKFLPAHARRGSFSTGIKKFKTCGFFYEAWGRSTGRIPQGFDPPYPPLIAVIAADSVFARRSRRCRRPRPLLLWFALPKLRDRSDTKRRLQRGDATPLLAVRPAPLLQHGRQTLSEPLRPAVRVLDALRREIEPLNIPL